MYGTAMYGDGTKQPMHSTRRTIPGLHVAQAKGIYKAPSNLNPRNVLG